MAFTGLKLTDFGLQCRVQSEAGKQLHLTRVALGDGEIGSGSFLTRKTLLSEKMSILIDDIRIGDTAASVIARISNSELDTGFYFREMGIYCQDPDTLEEGLYVYDNCREQGEYIGDKNSAVSVNFYLRLHLAVSQSMEITFDASGEPIYVLYEEFDQLEQDVRQYMQETDQALEQLDTQCGQIVQDLSVHVADMTTHLYPATCTYSGGVFTLSGLSATLPDIFTVRFKAPADFAEGDTFAVGSATLHAKLTNMEDAPDELFKFGAVVTMEVDTGAETAFFKSGGGFPDGWKDVRTAEAMEDIVKNQAIALRRYTNIDDGVDAVPSSVDMIQGKTGCSAAFSPDGKYLAVGVTNNPFIIIFKRCGDTFMMLELPILLPSGSGFGVAFSPDGDYLAVAHISDPYITIYKQSGDAFTKLNNPATLPASHGRGIAFSPDGNYLVIAHDSTPFVTIYKRNGDVFTKLANPATRPASNGQSVAFSPDGQYLAVAHNNSPYVTIYKQGGDVFTKLANPTTLPSGNGQSVAFSPDGMRLAVGQVGTPAVALYINNGDDTFSRMANLSPVPSDHGYAVAFSPNSVYLAVLHSASPYLTIYNGSAGTFVKVDNPSSLPRLSGNSPGVTFSPDGKYLAAAHYGTTDISGATVYFTIGGEFIFPFYRTGRTQTIFDSLGIALESAATGNPCKVNLFPALNDIGG